MTFATLRLGKTSVEEIRRLDSQTGGIHSPAIEISVVCTQVPADLMPGAYTFIWLATVYKGNIIKNLIMDCQSYTKYRPNETTGGIFVSWRRKEELPTGA